MDRSIMFSPEKRESLHKGTMFPPHIKCEEAENDNCGIISSSEYESPQSPTYIAEEKKWALKQGIDYSSAGTYFLEEIGYNSRWKEYPADVEYRNRNR